MRESAAVLVPQMNVNDDQAVIVVWQVSSGAHIETGNPIATLETTKATFDVHAPRAGYVFYRLERKSVVPVGSVLAWITDDENASPESLEAAVAQSSKPATTIGADDRFTRKASRRMRELGVSPDELPAEGRIEVADVERAAAARPHSTARSSASEVHSCDADARAAPAPELCEPLEQSTAKIMEAARLSEVYRSVVPSMVTLPLAPQRIQAKVAELSAGTGPVSLLELVIHEVAGILGEYPDLNGFYSGGRAWAYRRIAIGFAINAGKALKVPVVRDVADHSQLDVCRSVRDLTLRYFRDELSIADVSGGTFTVTDLSAHGVTHFVPVLNDRQSAILGICAPDLGGLQQNLVLAFDHRLSDGMRGAEFLRALRAHLEA